MNRWTKYNPKTGGILDADAMRDEVSAQAQLANGALTRDNLPSTAITAAMTASKAFQAYALTSDLQMGAGQIATYSGTENLGATYGSYSTGWINHPTTHTAVCVEGWLHVEFDCSVWIYGYYAEGTERYFKFRISVDGVTMAETDRVYLNLSSVRLVHDTPITTGTHTVSLSWTMDAPLGTETSADRRGYWFGGQIFTLNTYR